MAHPVAWVIGGTFVTLGPIIVKAVLRGLGFGLVTYTGLNVIGDQLIDFVTSNVALLPPEAFAMLGIMKIDIALSMLVSFIAIRAALSGVFGGKKRSVVAC